jgi:hypothetical protein
MSSRITFEQFEKMLNVDMMNLGNENKFKIIKLFINNKHTIRSWPQLTRLIEDLDINDRLKKTILDKVARNMTSAQRTPQVSLSRTSKSSQSTAQSSRKSSMPAQHGRHALNNEVRRHLEDKLQPKLANVFLPLTKWHNGNIHIQNKHELFTAAIRHPEIRRRINVLLRGRNAPMSVEDTMKLLHRFEIATKNNMNAARQRLTSRRYQVPARPSLVTAPTVARTQTRGNTISTISPKPVPASIRQMLENVKRLSTNEFVKRLIAKHSSQSTPATQAGSSKSKPSTSKKTSRASNTPQGTPQGSPQVSSSKRSRSRASNIPQGTPQVSSSKRSRSRASNTPQVSPQVSSSTSKRPRSTKAAPQANVSKATTASVVYGQNSKALGLF